MVYRARHEALCDDLPPAFLGHRHISDIRIAEGLHQSVVSTLGVPGGIAGRVYQGIRGVTRLLGKCMLAKLQPLQLPATPLRDAVLAALNGAIGDRLVASNSPLAIPMTLRWRGEALSWQSPPAGFPATGKVLLLVHGLCMNDRHWHARHQGQVVDHGAALALSLGYTPVYLRYNSGLHTSQNGRELSALLEQLVKHWPTPIRELTVMSHSMGGLVTRSAVHYAKRGALGWPAHLRNLVFLGTPHHGSPLERAGNWVDTVLRSTPFLAPLSRLGQVRSAGITDLRYGYVVDEDWLGHDRFCRKPDNREVVPLPEGVACYTVAATMARHRSALSNRLIGDGFVPLHSALGQHDDARRTLVSADASQWIAYGMSHHQLLSSPEVTLQLERWLGR